MDTYSGIIYVYIYNGIYIFYIAGCSVWEQSGLLANLVCFISKSDQICFVVFCGVLRVFCGCFVVFCECF